MIRCICHATKLLLHLVCQLVARHCLMLGTYPLYMQHVTKLDLSEYDAKIIFSIILNMARTDTILTHSL